MESEVKELFFFYEMFVINYQLVYLVDEVVVFVEQCGYLVVFKVASLDIYYKFDIGGVCFNLLDEVVVCEVY